jgi:MFS superfamily sulfate permease-like transporter
LLADVWHRDSPQVRRHAVYNLIVVLAVMAVTVFSSVVSGVIVGIVLSSVIFVINMSRPLVRHAWFGDEIYSERIRSADDLAILQQTGPRRAVLQLEGALFFGNADDLSIRVKQLLENADIVLLDMRAVSDLDISGINVLRALRDKARERHRHLVFCNVKPMHATILGNAIGFEPGSPPLLRGALATKQSSSCCLAPGLLRGACHRARIRATRWLAMTGLMLQTATELRSPAMNPGTSSSVIGLAKK